MKKNVLILLFTLLLPLFCSAQQVPENNLKRSLKEIQRRYPDLIKWNESSYALTYKSKSANILFYMYNGLVYKQCSFFEGDNNYLGNIYYQFANSFKGYESYHQHQSSTAISYFYLEYEVVIMYDPYDHVSIKYELYPKYYK